MNCHCHRRGDECDNCQPCPDCRRYVSELCDTCDKCGSCCDCWTCSGCDNQYAVGAPFCYRCQHCESCCNCGQNGSAGVRFFKNPVRFIESNRFKVNKSRRFAALEIELSRCADGTPIERVIKSYGGSIVGDATLPATGFEINMSPSNGDKLVDQISKIYKALDNAGAEVTTACGIHVHVDARDIDWFSMRKLVLLYESVEPGLFAIVAQSRQSNRYCRRVGDVYTSQLVTCHTRATSKAKLLENIYNEKPGRAIVGKKQNKYESARYYALNLHSKLHQESVEFRHSHSTLHEENARNWALLCVAIVDYAYNNTEKTILNLREKDPIAILCDDVAPQLAGWIRKRQDYFSRMRQ